MNISEETLDTSTFYHTQLIEHTGTTSR